MAEESVGSGKNKNSEPHSDDKRDASTGGLVDELRNVLSSLGKEKPKEFLPPEPPPLNSPMEKAEQNPFRETTDSLASSDADFWNGNVLGWSNGPDGGPPPLEPLPEKDQSFDTSDADNIVKQELDNPPSSPALDFPPLDFGGADNVLPPAPLSPVEQKAAVPPPPPPPPIEEPPAMETPSPEKSIEGFTPGRARIYDEATPDLVPEPRLEFSLAPSQPPESMAPSDVPIPLTLEKKAPPPSESKLDLVGNAAKPKGLVQIACVYPEGSEKEWQEFLSKLKQAGQKSRNALSIQAVLVQPWVPGKVDMPAWKKAASMSGADFLFVVASKKDAGLFKNSVEGLRREPGPRDRVVFVEQVSLRALYADILVELEREANGHG